MFYVYTYLREDSTPYYIGKGSGDRAYKKYSKKDIKPPKDISCITIVEKDLLEDQAFELEKHLIKKYGRKDLGTGILRNKTNGGEGSSGHKVKGWKWSEEAKEKRRGTGNPAYGKPRSEEARQKAQKSMIGFKHTDKSNGKKSVAMKGRFVGEKSPVYGRKKTSEEIEKQMKTRVYRPLSEEQKENLRQKNLGKKQSPASIAKMLATKAAKKAKLI